MSTTIVSIGGKIGRRTMSPPTWTAFRTETLGAVRDSLVEGAQVVFTGTGTGRWTDPETGRTEIEPSFTVIVAGDVDHERLRYLLAGLAARYSQQAIAVTTGPTTMVEASTVHAA